jgi:nucleoside-diphosphate-sugar epimerase
MKYFITGATGFIGGRVAIQLVESGHEVIALVRSPQKAKHLTDLGVSIAEGDVTDKESLRKPMTGVDGIFHLAAWYKIGARDKSMAERINVEGTRNVLEMMKELGIKKGVYTSTVAVFSDTKGKLVNETYRSNGPHLSEYNRTKWLAHYEVAEPMMKAGLPLVIVQPGVVYGPGDTSAVGETFKQYLQGRLPMLPATTAFCWAHVDDVARGHILAMEKGVPGESYILAGPPHTFVEAFELAEKITGVKAPRLRVNPAMLKLMSKFMGVIGAVVPLPETYTAESLRVAAGVTYLASNEKAKQELGYKVRPLEEGLQETLVYMMKELGLSPSWQGFVE